MNARQRKKVARDVCPRCRQAMGIWHWKRLRTGRLVSTIVMCYSDACYGDGEVVEPSQIGWHSTNSGIYRTGIAGHDSSFTVIDETEDPRAMMQILDQLEHGENIRR